MLIAGVLVEEVSRNLQICRFKLSKPASSVCHAALAALLSLHHYREPADKADKGHAIPDQCNRSALMLMMKFVL